MKIRCFLLTNYAIAREGDEGGIVGRSRHCSSSILPWLWSH